MEEKISASEKKYRELVENLNDFVYTVDKNSNITSVNKIVPEFLGYTIEQLYQMNFFQLISGAHQAQALEDFRTVIEKGREVRRT